MRRVLVTGASGFVGRHSLRCLLDFGYEVHAVFYRKPPPDDDDGVTWHRADLLNDDNCARLVREVRPTHLLHFAWYAVPGKFWTAAENLQWVGATTTLMQTFAEQGGQRVVMAGTCAEYDWTYPILAERTTPCRPATLYGACKLSAQLLLDAWTRQTGMSSAWGRLFFLYGPDEHPSRLVPSVIGAIQSGLPARCTHGNQVRDFMHTEDAANAFVALLDSDVSGVVNIASGNPVQLKELIFTIADALDGRSLVRLGAVPAPAGEPDRLIADVTRLRDEVRFVPRYGLKDGIANTIQQMQATARSAVELGGALR